MSFIAFDGYTNRQRYVQLCDDNQNFHAVAIKGRNFGIIAIGKKLPIFTEREKKLISFRNNFGCLMLGMASGGEKLIKKIANTLTEYEDTIGFPMSNETLQEYIECRTRQITNGNYLDSANALLCMCSANYAGGKVEICQIGPLGGCEKVQTIKTYGPKREKLCEFLLEKFPADKPLNEAIQLAVDGIGIALDCRLHARDIQVAVIGGEYQGFTILSDNYINRYIDATQDPVDNGCAVVEDKSFAQFLNAAIRVAHTTNTGAASYVDCESDFSPRNPFKIDRDSIAEPIDENDLPNTPKSRS